MNWNKTEKMFIDKFYTKTSTKLLTEVMGRTASSIYHKASRMSIVKSNRTSNTMLHPINGRRVNPCKTNSIMKRMSKTR